MVLGLTIASLVLSASAADAGRGRIAVSAQADVRVWIEGGDVFADYADVAIWVRPERDCYTTLFMVDTDGYMHVLYPSSSYDDTWLYGGRSYCYRACDLGLDRLDGSGIAYVFAVGSPAPFDYSVYDAGVFVGGFGFRVYGDPFVACRDFYMTLLPASCRWDYVGVSYARFYVRHWARYPSYLCYAGPGIHVRVGDGCRSCGDVYVSYRNSCSRPWDAYQPVPKFKTTHAGGRVHQDWNDDRGYARESRVERVHRETKVKSFKGEGYEQARGKGESFKSVHRSTEQSVKQVVKPSNRWNESARVAKGQSARVSNKETVRVQSRSTQVVKSPTKVKVTRERARVVSTSREIARSAGLDKSRSVSAPVVAHDARGRNDSKQIAYKASSKKSSSLAPQAREKGAAKKVRQAE